MKAKFFAACVLLLSLFGHSCTKKESGDNNTIPQPINRWEPLSEFPGPGREQAFSFVINNRFFVGMGTGVVGNSQQELADFYEYDAAANTWIKRADVPVDGRLDPVSFSINGKGYVGLGYYLNCPFPNTACTPVYSKEFWEYDPLTNVWKKVAVFNDDHDQFSIHSLTSFVVGSKAYIVNGTKLWQFDPVTYTFTQKAKCPELLEMPASFVINNKGYVTAAGTSEFLSTGEYSKRFYEYDPSQDKWARKADFAGSDRANAVGFSIKGKGYLGCGNGTNQTTPGQIQIVPVNDYWQYDPAADKWTKATEYPGKGLIRKVAAATNDYVIIGTGWYLNHNLANDFWKYTP